MKNLLNNTIYSEGKYPIFLFLSSEYVKDINNSIPHKSVEVSPDISMFVNLPLGSFYMPNFSLLQSSVPPSPIKIGDKDLNDIYIESKDHSKYVKFSWYDPSTEVLRAANPYYMNSSENPEEDLSWIHYISYRDEEGIFKGNILEFCPILSFSVSAENINKVSWTDLRNLIFIKPKDNPIDFVWGNIDSTSPGENNPNLFTELMIHSSSVN